MKVKISRQIDVLGRLVIPIDLRKMYGFKPGDRVWFTTYDNGILIHSEEMMYHRDKKNEE